ncbi:MAG: hypothetical protein U1B78_08105, partial [Dehalococcoidia bacterium]|nr:hypothetical protein [Dehalococcoidia bacterium]
AVSEGRVRIEGRRVVDRQERELPRGLDLSVEVDAAVEPALGAGSGRNWDKERPVPGTGGGGT